MEHINNIKKSLTVLYTVSVLFVWKQNEICNCIRRWKLFLFPVCGLQDVSFSCLVLLMRMWWLLLPIFNCFCSVILFFDHLVIFDSGTKCHWYLGLETHLWDVYWKPKAVRLSHACVPEALRSKVFSQSESVNFTVCHFWNAHY